MAGSDGRGDGTGWQVFISHTSELRDFPAGGSSYVAEVERAITAARHVIVDMADFPAADQPPAQVCAERVRGCDVYVGVLGTRYGSPVRDKPEVSYTELEFDTATAAGLPRLVFLLDTGAADVGIPLDELIDHQFGARQQAFRSRVQDSGLTTQSFRSPAELGRLVERSLRELADTRRGTGSLPPGSVLRVWNIPARNPGFTGRDDLLAVMRERFQAGGKAVVQALYGMGGVGKTQLAAEYAHRFTADYDLAWWVNSEQGGLIGDQFAALGLALGCVPSGAKMEVVRAVVLAELRERVRWLLVFDNAASPADVTPWLSGGTGHVLITSRGRGWAEVALPVEVDVLTRPESVAILQDRVIGLTEADADRLAGELGDLPLAIAQAAGFMAETGIGAEEYLRLLRSRARETMAEGAPTSYPGSLAAATQLIADRLAREDPAAAELASMCAFLAPEPIPAELFTGAASELPDGLAARVADPLAWRQTLAHLARQSLARVDHRGLQIHRLTQAIVRDWLSPRERWATAAVELVASAFPSSIEGLADPGQWQRCARLLPHARAAAEHAHEARVAEATAANLLRRAGSYLERRGEYAGARDLLERSLELTGAVRGPGHLEVAYVLSALGFLLQGQRELDTARRTHERALAIYEAHLPPDHSGRGGTLDSDIGRDIGRALNNLGLVRYLQEDLDGARGYLERALETNETAFGPDHPEVASTLNNLGQVLHRVGDLAGARSLHERALAIKEAADGFGPDSPSVAETLNYLGIVLRDLGELRAARDAHQRALDIFQALFPSDHHDVRTSREHLTAVQQALDEQADGAAEPPRDTPLAT